MRGRFAGAGVWRKKIERLRVGNSGHPKHSFEECGQHLLPEVYGGVIVINYTDALHNNTVLCATD